MSPGKDINLLSLQRVDPCAQVIIDQATQVALYKFRSGSHDWEKTGIEGCMFVYKRCASPYYNLIILNRQSPKDYVEPILEHLQFQIQKPYLFYMKNGIINGLWFYKESDCERISKLFNLLINDPHGTTSLLNTLSSPTQSSCVSQTSTIKEELKTPQKADILQMLSKARNDYSKESLEMNDCDSASIIRRPTPVRAEPKPIVPSSCESSSERIEALFASASGTSLDKLALTDKNKYEPTLASSVAPPPVPDVLQRLFSAPPSTETHSLVKGTRSASELEKEIISQQRNTNEVRTNGVTNGAPRRKLSNAEADESLFCAALPAFESTPGRHNNDSFASGPLFSNDLTALDDTDLMYNINPPDLLITPQELTATSVIPTTRNLGNGSTSSSTTSGLTRNLSMVPNVGSGRVSPTTSFADNTGFATPQSVLPEAHVGPGPSVAPLTKEQMMQAFQYMLKNDPGFVTQLHEAYVKSLNASLGIRRTS